MATTIQTESPADERPAEADAAEQPADEITDETADGATVEAKEKPVAATPAGPGNPETFITGDQGPAISDEERQRRAAILAMQMREIDEEDARRAAEERSKKKDDSQGPQQERSRLGSLYTRWGLMIQTNDDFFTVKGGQQTASNPNKHINDAQLKAMILTAALEKNWHTLYFYKDRGTIDPSLTGRAQQMIMELQRPGQPLEGYAMRVSQVRMREVEPWNQGRPLYGLFRDAANYKDDTVRGISNGISSRWNSLVTGTMFTAKPGDAAPQADAESAAPAKKEAAADTAAAPVADVAAEAVKRVIPAALPGAGR